MCALLKTNARDGPDTDTARRLRHDALHIVRWYADEVDEGSGGTAAHFDRSGRTRALDPGGQFPGPAAAT